MVQGPVARTWRRVSRPGRLAWVIWALGTCCYGLSIMGRSALSGIGTEATARFRVSATELSSLSVLQVGIYGVLQVPVGLLLDRFGARRLLLVGMVTLALGQVLMGQAESYPAALVARFITGAGDALVFPSILRTLPLFFPPRSLPLLVQVTAMLGQSGQLLSIVGLRALVQHWSWTGAFTTAAATTVLVGVVTVLVLRGDSPQPSVTAARSGLGARIAAAWSRPGTRLAFWTHAATPFSANAVTLLWGYPFLTLAEGVPASTAAALFVVGTASGVLIGPALGMASVAVPGRRVPMTLICITAQVLVWGLVLLWPGPAPLSLLALLMVAISVGGPGSIMAFDHVRQHNPPELLATATGVVNTGGFAASLLAIAAIGVVLDLLGGIPGAWTPGQLRTAMSSQYLLWAIGLVGVLVSARQVRRTAGTGLRR